MAVTAAGKAIVARRKRSIFSVPRMRNRERAYAASGFTVRCATTERITRPTFGTDTAEYVFMDMNQTYLTIMKRDLTESILRQEPRVSSVDIETSMESQQGYILITIDYTVANTNQRDNLVFPFYLNAEPEPEEEEEYFEPDVIDVDMYETDTVE